MAESRMKMLSPKFFQHVVESNLLNNETVYSRKDLESMIAAEEAKGVETPKVQSFVEFCVKHGHLTRVKTGHFTFEPPEEERLDLTAVEVGKAVHEEVVQEPQDDVQTDQNDDDVQTHDDDASTPQEASQDRVSFRLNVVISHSQMRMPRKMKKRLKMGLAKSNPYLRVKDVRMEYAPSVEWVY